MNKVILLANATRDAEHKEVSGGTSICTFGMATNRAWKDVNGEKRSPPEYHSIIYWRGLAKFASQYVKKGKPLYMESYLKTHSWETTEGSRKDRTEVIMENIVLLVPRMQVLTYRVNTNKTANE